ncbi:Tripartite motif-containing protein 3-like [Oopsacas minuta]|uniref:Tripartite motif-containing protein 3-like n=1 Tax=Oopsacas minuta TaxID=111878 RepID=A0AAV7JJ54_9METZ|nr:Tripartite motif-containing protein 3-like [Oopsacas minuta]
MMNPIPSVSLSGFLQTQGECSKCNTQSKLGLILLDCFHCVCEDCIYKCADSESKQLVRCPVPTCRHCTLFQDRTPYNLLAEDLAFVLTVKEKASSNKLVCCTCVNHQVGSGHSLCLDCHLVFCKEDAKYHKKYGRSVSKKHQLLTREELNKITIEDLLKELQNKFGSCNRHNGNLIEKYSVVNGDYLCDKCASKDCMDHLMYTTQDILATSKGVLNKSIKKGQKTCSQSNHLIASLTKEFSRIMRTKDEVLERVGSFYNSLLTEIEIVRDDTLSKIGDKFEANLEELNACISSVQNLTDIHQRVYNYTELAYHFCSGKHLYSSYDTLQVKLEKMACDLATFKVPNFGDVSFKINKSMTSGRELIESFASLHLGSKYETGELVLGPTIPVPEPLLWINGIFLDKEGSMFVADGNNSCIHIFSNESYVKKVGDKADLKCPMGVSVSGNFVYVTDWMAHTLLSYNLSGKLVKKIGSNGSGAQEFWCPKGIAISESKEKIFVADLGNSRIKVYGLDLELKSYFSHDDIHGPKDVLVNSDTLIVLDSKSPFLHLFDLTGTLLRHLVDRSQPLLLKDPAFFTLDGENNVIIADEIGNSLVVYYLPENSYTQHSLGNDITKFSEPTGIAADLNGSLIIGNNGNKQLMKCFIKTTTSFV